ncbi:TPA: hypothetical protein ACXOK1_003586 [Proteus mirabilis]
MLADMPEIGHNIYIETGWSNKMYLITWLKKNGFEVEEEIIQKSDVNQIDIINESYLGNSKFCLYEKDNDCEPIFILYLQSLVTKVWTVGKVYNDPEYNNGDNLSEKEIKKILKKYIQ